MRRAKIVCTLGPATSTPDRIGELIDAGMDVARLNFSHGEREVHHQMLKVVRAEAEKRDKSVAVLLDVQGPKIRVGRFASGQVELKAGAEFIITSEQGVMGDERRVSTSYLGLPNDVRPGDHILLDDGLFTLAVSKVVDHDVHCVVVSGGVLRNNKGINLPGVAVSAPALTDKDKADIDFGLRIGVDFIALSFVRNPEDVLQARRLATAGDSRIPIIAKIEKPQALEHIDAIIAASDGIMVARGDLGIEVGVEKVPLVQKQLIAATNKAGKVVITATQMLESMIKNPRPTRAEASDVANAVLDGTDALMLSGETAAGDHPIEVVRTMDRIIREVEHGSRQPLRGADGPWLDLKVSTNAIAHAATIAARQLSIKHICVVTDSGGAARLMSEYRPDARIIALTTDEATCRRLALYWGVTPYLMRPSATVEELVDNVEEFMIERELALPGEHVCITGAVPVGAGAPTNSLRLHKLRPRPRA